MKKTKDIRQAFSIPASTPSGQQTDVQFTLNKAGFSRIKAMLSNMISDGGLSNNFDVALIDPSGNPIKDQVNMASFGFISPDTTNVGPKERWDDEVEFPIENGNYTIQVKTYAATTKTLNLELVFRAEADNY